MAEKKGNLSVHSENIFPIIRQWLYSEKDIFIRELVSNAADALAKRRLLMKTGDIEEDPNPGRIDLKLDTENHQLTIRDNGIGMSEEDIDRYINQIAYSGLLDFVKKYKGGDEGGSAVIGHFGLGFYSSFMVADKVEIESLSCQNGVKAAHWESQEGSEYLLREGQKQEIGSDIVLSLSEEAAKEYTEEKIRSLLKRYVLFLPWPIYFQDEQINLPEPIWEDDLKKLPAEDVKTFYHKVFPDQADPLFWLPLNLDYPFRLKGVLFFPNEKELFRSPKGRLNVYSRRIFVSDEMREMLPDYLFLLQGCLDCPDLPLNVSRSYLQEDRQVRALSSYITRKVAEALDELFRGERERFSELWPSLERFVKVGTLQDDKFADKARNFSLLKREDGGFDAWKDLLEGTHYYRDSSSSQELYAERLRTKGETIYCFEGPLDLQWLAYLEYQSMGKQHFIRVDAEDESAGASQHPQDDKVFSKLRDFEGYSMDRKGLGAESAPAMIVENENERRFLEMRRYLEEQGLSPDEILAGGKRTLSRRLILNTDHPMLSLFDAAEDEKKEDFARYLFHLALLSRGELHGDAYRDFMTQNLALWKKTVEK